MDPKELGQARYARMRWNTPLAIDHADALLKRLGASPTDRLLDLGCGWGELLIRGLLRADDTVTAIGVDRDPVGLARGRVRAAEVGLETRIEFVQEPAEQWADPADRVLCIGASQAWGGAAQALEALTGLVRPGGRLLFGDGCWEKPPTGAAMAMFGDSVMPLADLVALATGTGWSVLALSTADQREWDDFESTWRLGRQEWLLAQDDAAASEPMATEVERQLMEYVGVYRAVLGFAYLVLARGPSSA
jgi:cyclopropane fatty-acyl-phospholipid synthase-like methyltransferase